MAKQSVMVIDDEESILFILKDFLAGLNLQPHMCATLQQAVEVLKKEPINIILCDVTLPDGKGTDFYYKIVQTYPHLKDRFILMTGYSLDDSLETFLNDNRISFIQKPFQLDLIRSKIMEILKKS